MDSTNAFFDSLSATKLLSDAGDYTLDFCQRSILYWDIMRKRGNLYFERLRGEPSVLVFDYDIVMDGHELPRPVNYSLARIKPPEGVAIDPGKRPIVIFDPRAGQGPGIGGSKLDSEIGMALEDGRSVYFLIFDREPLPGQTITDVEQAEARFVEKVGELHPNAEKPAVIGNCQGGWAVALMGADRPDITGPLMLNGSPLSYWGGPAGSDPMRYEGALLGGAWVTSFLCDMLNGEFDGAHLILNFERLNIANTLWTKQYNLFARADTEEERYLSFEKWWNGYFMMGRDEIHYIVKDLFIGDELERGRLKLDNGSTIDLKHIDRPVVVFASRGDNITPPAQALNWIPQVYEDVDEIRRHGKIIVYLLDERVGHLGIFVSGHIADKQHKELIRHVDTVELLPPGLYEMKIDDAGKKEGISDFEVRYEPRTMDDVLAVVGEKEEDVEFEVAAAISDANDRMYLKYVSPWVRAWSNPVSAEFVKQMHPERITRYMFSDLNPIAWPFKALAPTAKKNRKQAAPDNVFLGMQEFWSNRVKESLENAQKVYDESLKMAFKATYGNPFLEYFLLGKTSAKEGKPEIERDRVAEQEVARADTAHWNALMGTGGIPEASARIVLALLVADEEYPAEVIDGLRKHLSEENGIAAMTDDEFHSLFQNQARILQTDEDSALNALPSLIPDTEDRNRVFEAAQKAAVGDRKLDERQEEILERIRRILDM